MSEVKRVEKGKFAKGHSGNISGKAKGTENKTLAEIRSLLRDIFTDGLDKMKAELAKLKGVAYVKAYIDIAKIVLPPLQAETEKTENPYEHPVTVVKVPTDEPSEKTENPYEHPVTVIKEPTDEPSEKEKS
jgi:hypothetical protein